MEVIKNHNNGEILLECGYVHAHSSQRGPKPFRRITLEEVQVLQRNNWIYFIDERGKWKQCRVTGKVKTWKRDPNRIRVPLKYGLYHSFAITEKNLHEFVVPLWEEEA